MKFKLLYRTSTRIGKFYIGRSEDLRYHPIFENESLGSYWSAEQAVDDLTGGHTISLGFEIDTATLDIPDELSKWDQPPFED